MKSSHWHMHECYIIQEILGIANGGSKETNQIKKWLRQGYNDKDLSINAILEVSNTKIPNDLNVWVTDYCESLECDQSDVHTRVDQTLTLT